ncbi:phosphate ABC transporter permease PstA [Streptomyces sp. ADMS]|uniref:phosphate ABC transporter permease PstA n=1 Tax=Streptomyces sp. ADMS TaxID=3071415 RepID=UPI00296E700D|nr:phosphate ABC transporter permease PstA [Streptomyces sp. ADMS]MDW4910026.1 phosphate ABC transporter permease PstA [Streptomyces sp. ADMS]
MSAPVKDVAPAASGRGMLAGPRFRPGESLFRWLLLACLALGIIFLVSLLAYLVVEAWPRLDARLWNNFPSIRRPENAGAQSAIMGTIWVISFTALFCLPTGIMAAIYLEEYADSSRWYNRLIEVNIQNLAAVPSIIYGILGLGLLARQFGLGTTVLTAALTLSLLVLPVVIIASREAIRAVPQSIRQASLALGATQWQTIWRQVLPAAIPGMATGSILALSRAIGEAAPVIMLGAVTFVMFNPEGLQSSYTVLPVQIYNWISQSREEFHHLAAAAIILLLGILLVMNAIAIWLRNRYSRRW